MRSGERHLPFFMQRSVTAEMIHRHDDIANTFDSNSYSSESNTFINTIYKDKNHGTRKIYASVSSGQQTLFMFILIVCTYVTNVVGQNTQPTTLLPAPEVLQGNITSSSMTITFPSLLSQAAGDILAYELEYKSIIAQDWSTASSSIESINEQREAQILSIKVDEGHTVNDGYFILGLQRSGGLSSGINERRDVVGKYVCLFVCLYHHLPYKVFMYRIISHRICIYVFHGSLILRLLPMT